MIVHSIVKLIRDKVVAGKTKRSSEWPKVRKAYLKDHPTCAVCDSTKKAEVHHRKPFHIYPELELDPKNFITLCEGKEFGIICHLISGHLDCFKWENPNVDSDVKKAVSIISKYNNKATVECVAELKDYAAELRARGKADSELPLPKGKGFPFQ